MSPPNPHAPSNNTQSLIRIEGHYRKFLAARWFGLTLRSAVLTSLSFIIIPGVFIKWDYTIGSALASIFLIGPILYLATLHVVLRVRRSWIIRPPVLATKPSTFSVIWFTFSSRVLVFLSVHGIYGAVFAAAFALALNQRYPDADLGLLNVTARHPWHGNERVLFLVVANCLFFITISLRDVLEFPLSTQWPKARLRFDQAVRRSLIECLTGFRHSSLLYDLSFAFAWSFCYSAFYFSLRAWTWRFAITHFPVLRPFVINFAKSSRSNMTWSLTYYLLVLQLTSLVVLKPPVAVLKDYLTQPFIFSSFTRRSPLSPERYLLEALKQIKNPFYINHTLLELQRIVHLKARRQAFFADVSKDSPMIHELWHTLLIHLGHSYQALQGKTALPNHVRIQNVEIPSAKRDTHTIPIKRANVFRATPEPHSLIYNIAHNVIDGSTRPKSQPVLRADSVVRTEASINKLIEGRVTQAEQWGQNAPVIWVLFAMSRWTSEKTTQWTGIQWARRTVAIAVPEFDKLGRIVDILTTLAIASLEEDSYGYVQTVLPATLEAFIRIRTATVALEVKLLAQAKKIGTPASTEINAELSHIFRVIDDGILRIADRFGGTLTAFRFPPEVAQALTDLCRTANI